MHISEVRDGLKAEKLHRIRDYLTSHPEIDLIVLPGVQVYGVDIRLDDRRNLRISQHLGGMAGAAYVGSKIGKLSNLNENIWFVYDDYINERDPEGQATRVCTEGNAMNGFIMKPQIMDYLNKNPLSPYFSFEFEGSTYELKSVGNLRMNPGCYLQSRRVPGERWPRYRVVKRFDYRDFINNVFHKSRVDEAFRRYIASQPAYQRDILEYLWENAPTSVYKSPLLHYGGDKMLKMAREVDEYIIGDDVVDDLVGTTVTF